MKPQVQPPSFAFVAVSWTALLLGLAAYLIGVWNANMQLNERGYYFTVLVYGLFAAVSVQKSVRDRVEDVPVTGIYYGLCWLSALLAVGLLCVGLYNATLAQSEKGFFGMAYALALFGAIAVQKNTRDITATKPVTLEARLAQLREEAPKAPALNPAAASETPVRRG
ncbi:inner membrane protein YiaA [Ralstonia pseudosolanacearum]|uniref:inner membrane protein YiaA n=1 Tax=Ralstonia pseudosolanacearum TaxID=1310165 RepID=UPI003862FE35